jgi:hypothetical protein
MQRTLQLQHGAHVASRTAGRYVNILPSLSIFRPPRRPRAAILSPCAVRVRAVRATAVNKKMLAAERLNTC